MQKTLNNKCGKMPKKSNYSAAIFATTILSMPAVNVATTATIAVVASTTSMLSQAQVLSESQILAARITPDFIEKEFQKAQNKNQILSVTVNSYLQSQLPDGSWSDINYANTSQASWSPADHLRRLRAMAAIFANASSAQQAQTEFINLKNGIKAGIDHWYSVNPTSTNWWWGDIGKQLYLGPIALMMEGHLASYQKNNVIGDMPLTPSSAGANKTDFSKLVIYGGLLLADNNRITSGMNGINESIIITDGEGIQVDYSFHQHGAQLHNGSYGKVFFNTAIYWAYQIRDLQWSFSAAKTNILTSYFLDSDRWVTRGGKIDYSTRGRGISRAEPENPSNDTLLKQIDYVAALAPTRTAETNAYKAHLQGGVANLNGFKHFWRSDYSANMKDVYLFTVHMASKRVATTETGNGENLLGYWLGFGNTFLTLRGDEYHNIFPVWDWKYIPGVTSPAYEGIGGAWGKHLHQSTFVGGVANGAYGVTTMDLNIMGTQAKKSWFHFADEIVALGAGINSTSNLDINTTINQSLLNGPVTVDGSVYPNGQTQLINANWVHHDNIGYVFPELWSGVMSNKSQSGKWSRINNNQSTDVVTKDVFTLRVDHNIQPIDDSYQYILLPGKTSAEVAQYSITTPVTVIVNTKTTQAVRHSALNQTGIVFHQAGSQEISPGLIVSVDRPSTLLLDQSQGNMTVSASTPGSVGGVLKVCMQYGNSATLVDAIAMPSASNESGKTITKLFNGVAGDCQPAPPVTSLLPSDDAFVRGGSHANSNWGNRSYLVANNATNASYNRKTFLRWDLTQINATTVANAQVKVYIPNLKTSPAKLNIHKTGDSWQENNITWNNSPNTGWLFAQPVVSGAGQWVTFDATDFVNAELAGDKNMSMVMIAETPGVYLGFNSKENAQFKPELILTY